jgi:biopolymer transport protein ExbD
MLSRIVLTFAIAWPLPGFGLTVFEASTDGFWPENSVPVAVDQQGVIWVNHMRVGPQEAGYFVTRMRATQKIDAVVIHADPPFHEESEQIKELVEVLETVENLHVYYVK